MLTSLKKVLEKARRGRYAVGAFNVNNLEMLQAVIESAVLEKAPVIISTSEGAIAYAGLDELGALIHLAAARAKIPVVMHLDHGKDLRLIEKAIKSGWYTSVMYDGSALSLATNRKNTQRVVKLAHRYGINVEAELGAIAGIEDLVSVEARNAHLTNPAEALAFVRATGCDALAVAVGTSHGAYKFQGASRLDFPRLQTLGQTIPVPLVLHGASGVPEKFKKTAERYGAKIAKAKGVSDANIRRAISLGITKVNIDTDLRLAFTAGLRQFLHLNPAIIDPRQILTPAKSQVTALVREKIRLLGASRRG